MGHHASCHSTAQGTSRGGDDVAREGTSQYFSIPYKGCPRANVRGFWRGKGQNPSPSVRVCTWELPSNSASVRQIPTSARCIW